MRLTLAIPGRIHAASQSFPGANQKRKGMKHPELIIIGFTALLAGTLVYLTDRPPEATYFVAEIMSGSSLYKVSPSVFARVGNVLPAFVHPFAFSLITAGLVARSMRGCFLIGIFWLFVNIAFELGQHFKQFALALVPQWFAHIPFLENCGGFFRNGTFDPFDLLAMLLGTVLAFTLMAVACTRKKQTLPK